MANSRPGSIKNNSLINSEEKPSAATTFTSGEEPANLNSEIKQ